VDDLEALDDGQYAPAGGNQPPDSAWPASSVHGESSPDEEQAPEPFSPEHGVSAAAEEPWTAHADEDYEAESLSALNPEDGSGRQSGEDARSLQNVTVLKRVPPSNVPLTATPSNQDKEEGVAGGAAPYTVAADLTVAPEPRVRGPRRRGPAAALASGTAAAGFPFAVGQRADALDGRSAQLTSHRLGSDDMEDDALEVSPSPDAVAASRFGRQRGHGRQAVSSDAAEAQGSIAAAKPSVGAARGSLDADRAGPAGNAAAKADVVGGGRLPGQALETNGPAPAAAEVPEEMSPDKVCLTYGRTTAISTSASAFGPRFCLWHHYSKALYYAAMTLVGAST
jgi:hypothetical protein